LENAELANRVNFESSSNVTDDRERHPEKQDSQITSTDEGM
jgi:hypothetical protein